MFRTARRLKGHQQGSARKQRGSARKQQGSARKQQGSARKQQGSARKQQQQQQHQRHEWSDIRSFLRRLFWCVAVRRSAGGNGSRTRLDLPSFFSFFPPFFFLHVRRSGVSRIRPGFFPCFFHVRRSGVRRIRPDLPLFFPLFFHVRRSGVSRIRPGLPLLFSPFFPRQEECWGPRQARFALVFFPFFPRQEECWGPHQARFALVFFPFFSTSGGVGRRRQLCRVGGPSGDCSLSLWGTCILLRGRMEIQGASQACFFFKRLHHLAA